jgi:hypothetical protein
MNVVLHYLAGKGGDTFALAPMENCAVRRVELSTHVP